jgi:hypothetical protein
MGLWRRRLGDSRSVKRATGAGGGTDDARVDADATLPPLRLDRGADPVFDDPDDGWPQDPPRSRSWQPWTALALAVIVGAVAGVVGANARNDALQQSRVELIGGAVQIHGPADPNAEDMWAAEFSVFNSGQREVEVLEVAIEGWTFIDHGGTRDSVVTAAADGRRGRSGSRPTATRVPRRTAR